MAGQLRRRLVRVVEHEIHVLIGGHELPRQATGILEGQRHPLLEEPVEEMRRTVRHVPRDRRSTFSLSGLRPKRRSGYPPCPLSTRMDFPVRVSKGLDDVSVGETRISWVGGETGDLVLRGFDIRELVPGLPYESVVHLLLYGEPPNADPSPEVVDALGRERVVPARMENVIDALPLDIPPLEALRTILSALGDGSYGYPPTTEEGLRLVARVPVLLARFVRRSMGLPPLRPCDDLSHAANYLWMLTGTIPEPERVAALEGYLDLLADHGMNASTFALRVAISTQSDLVSAETAALGTLKGPVHGGAPSRVTEMLDAIGRPERADAWVKERLERRQVIFGFGHRVYKTDDPRALILHEIARRVANPARLELAEHVEAVTLEALRRAKPAARLYTNVEYYSAVVLEAVGLPPALFTPTFAVARTAGWAAHALEQALDNRLIRPEMRYVGPPRGQRWPRPLPQLGTDGPRGAEGSATEEGPTTAPSRGRRRGRRP